MSEFFISDNEWQLFENTIDAFHDDAFQQTVTLKSCIRERGEFGTDAEPLYQEIGLKGLILYNHFRTWPINNETITGEVDKESVLLFLNTTFLESLGLLNDNRLLKFNPANDIFIIDGLEYKPSGDSKTSQTKTKTLINFIVLRRSTIETQQDKY